MNPFELLEVSQDASPDEIRAAYHRLAKQWHPDRFSGDEKSKAEDKFRQLAEAFAALKDPLKRQSYQTGRTAPAGAPPTPAASAAQAVPAAQERSAEGWAEESRKALAGGQWDKAKGFAQYALRMEPARAEFHLLLSQVLEAEGRDLRGAIRSLETYLRATPRDADGLVRLAGLYEGQGMQARAQRLLEEARAIDPNHKRFKAAAEAKAKSQPPALEPAGIMDQLKGLWAKLAGKG